MKTLDDPLITNGGKQQAENHYNGAKIKLQTKCTTSCLADSSDTCGVARKEALCVKLLIRQWYYF